MRRVEGLDDVAGIVGFELLKRFPVKLDYERSRAIFYDPAKFKYAGTGARVPILFRGTNPQARGASTASMACSISTPAAAAR